ncbi:MAG: hypothetical protein JXI33_02810 [Candidatus Aminicenantes bacterium]|nr:hypothetical protein [Candidatus Aminicenantes bacterium]
MMKDTLTFWDYLKAAFHLKVPFKALGHLPLNKLVLAGFAILALGHPGFLFLGLAYESAYLLSLSGNGRFQSIVQGEKLADKRKSQAQKQQGVLQILSAEDRDRYINLECKCEKIHNKYGLPAPESGLKSLQSEALSQLSAIFLKLLHSRRTSRELLEELSEKNLREEIRQVEVKLAGEAEGSALARPLKGTLEIQKRRLDNLLRVKESLKVTDAELDRIEKQVTLISEESIISGDPQILTSRLDGVIRSLEDTQKWISDSSELFAAMESDSHAASPLPAPKKARLKE